MKIYQGKTTGGFSWYTKEVKPRINGLRIYDLIFTEKNGTYIVPRIVVSHIVENVDLFISSIAEKNEPYDFSDEWR